MKLATNLPTTGVKEGLDRRLLPAVNLNRPGAWKCPEHGFLLETLIPGEVFCRCGQSAVRARRFAVEEPRSQAVPVGG